MKTTITTYKNHEIKQTSEHRFYVKRFNERIEGQVMFTTLDKAQHYIDTRCGYAARLIDFKVTDFGRKYITIYEVRVHLISEDRNLTSDRFATRKDAEEEVERKYKYHKSLYDKAWVMEQIVWL